VLALVGIELGARGEREPPEVVEAADRGRRDAGLVELAPPEARRRVGVGDDRAQPLALQSSELIARQALQARVVDDVVGQRHGAAAARVPMPKARSALPA
jgi:hypothetical protein